MTEREQLLFTIAYAVKIKAAMPTRRKGDPPLDVKDYSGVARAIVEHLEQCGYRIERKAYDGHGPGLHGRLV